MFNRKKVRPKTQQSTLRALGFHFLEYRHQDHPQNYHVNPQILRDCSAFVNAPPAILKGVVIAEKFYKEPCGAVEYEHQTKGTAGLAKELVGAF